MDHRLRSQEVNPLRTALLELRSHNPDVKLRHMAAKFRPYSTNTTVPLLGSMDVKLTNNREKYTSRESTSQKDKRKTC